ncbi:GntR family transcriptional regulator [Marinicella rhabdoformis]|uniref:GntR family transcriptional regulator n=1 Tax=Marinicella rhabdoformis TaxID=2580566 RepID=UPI001C555DDD|nr:GntR family transcriptional regulator [Marinicella rhabdoformis]
MPLDFILSQTDGRPMYLQIMAQIKQRITLGDWPLGAKLPSIRELAVAAKVSVITVKRAYQELEAEGVIVTQPGRGSFVAEIENLSDHLKEEEMDKHLKEAMTIAQSLGLNIKQVQQRLESLQAAEKHQSTKTNSSADVGHD